MRTIKPNSQLLVATFCILASFIIPVTALAADCPCFTEKDVMRYASHPAKFACNWNDSQGVMRLLVRGPYTAYFSISADEYGVDFQCQARVTIGNADGEIAVLLDRRIELGHMDHDEYFACWALLDDDDLPLCIFSE